MSNRIYAPFLNPVKFQEMEPTLIDQYVSKFMDDWLFSNTIRQWEQAVKYRDRWLNNDSIRLQYRSNFAPLTLKLFSCDGEEIISVPFETKQQDFFQPDFYIRQIELDLATFDPGYYYLTVPEVDWVSEPFEILEEEAVDNPTLYIEYTHNEEYGQIIFDAPFEPALRVPGILKYKTPASRDTVYEDQDEGIQMIKSVPYRIWNLIIGGREGVPPYLIDKISRILGCSTVLIDGREFAKNEGAQWEPVELDNYPMAGWSIEVREKLNRDSMIYENDENQRQGNAMILITDTKGFGIEDNGEDYLEVQDIE